MLQLYKRFHVMSIVNLRLVCMTYNLSIIDKCPFLHYNNHMEKRFFVNREDISDESITIHDDEHQHLAKVMRLRVGDEVECFYDGSEVYKCRIDEIDKRETHLTVLSSSPCDSNPVLNITLFQALPKLDKLELISQKICEIGATCVVPFSSKFCIAKDNSAKIDRLNKIIISSCKQCGRTRLLDVHSTVSFNEMLGMLGDYDIVLFANEKENTTTLRDLLVGKSYRNVAVIVGSEGGFSDDEIKVLCEASQSFTFGKRILRCETAGIVAVANVECLLG